jgi:hypothetical protein
MSLQPDEIVLNLLSIQKIFGTDAGNAEVCGRTAGAFAELASNPAVATATQIACDLAQPPQHPKYTP